MGMGMHEEEKRGGNRDYQEQNSKESAILLAAWDNRPGQTQ